MRLKEEFVRVIYLFSSHKTKSQWMSWALLACGLMTPLLIPRPPPFAARCLLLFLLKKKNSDWFSLIIPKRFDYLGPAWSNRDLLLPGQRAHLGQGFVGHFCKETSLSERPARVSLDPKVKALRENEGE